MKNETRELTLEEYIKEYLGYPLFMGGEFYQDDELLEFIIENREAITSDNEIEYDDLDIEIPVYGTSKYDIELNPHQIIRDIENDDNAYEDFAVDIEAEKEIIEFCKKWNEKWNYHSYFEDKSIVINLDKELGRE